MKHTEMTREQISALADGQLDGDGFAQAMGHIGEADDLRATWSTYHLIGDVLRSSELARGAADIDFVTRLQNKLAAEPRPVLVEMPDRAVVWQAEGNGMAQTPSAMGQREPKASNGDLFRWKAVAGFASLAAVAAIGWNSFAVVSGGASNAVLASAAPDQARAVQAASSVGGAGGDTAFNRAPLFAASVPVTVAGSDAPQIMIRNPRLDEFLAAHSQATAGSVMQSPQGFVRNANFEGGAR